MTLMGFGRTVQHVHLSTLEATGTTMTTTNVLQTSLHYFKQPFPFQPSLSSLGGTRKKTNHDTTTTTTTHAGDNHDNSNSDKDDDDDDDDPTWIDRQVEEPPLPNPPIPNGTETFSACLLVMDDNHRLVEWLAYHYHVLPLRFLIVAIDPRSQTSPTTVLNRWRRLRTRSRNNNNTNNNNNSHNDERMYIEEWTDEDILPPSLAHNPIPLNATLQLKRDRHRIRQRLFYQKCLLHCQQHARTWVTLIDTDEFLMYNHKGGGKEQYLQWEQEQRQKLLLYQDGRLADRIRIPLSQPPPTPAQEGAMIHYIRQEQASGHVFFQRPCISIPRLQFGALEEDKEDVTSDQKLQPHPQQPNSIWVDRLDTLRFRKHAPRQDFVKNGLSKSILDVSRIQSIPKIQSLHRPIKTLCSAPWKDDWDSGLRINHYLGSWEAYSFRDDSRRGGERSYEGWAFKAQDVEETDDNIRPWIDGFVEQHGEENAKELLRGAGLPKGFRSSLAKDGDNGGNEKNWTIMFLDEILSVNQTTGNDARVAFDTFVRDFHFNKKQSTKGLV